MIPAQQTKQTNTQAFSKAVPKSLQHLFPKKIGVRECEGCGNEVPIYLQNGKKHSRCLACDNLALEKEMIEFQEETAADAFFWNNSLVPPDIQKATFGNFNVKGLSDSQMDAFRKLKWYAENFENWGDFDSLLLQGNYAKESLVSQRCAVCQRAAEKSDLRQYKNAATENPKLIRG